MDNEGSIQEVSNSGDTKQQTNIKDLHGNNNNPVFNIIFGPKENLDEIVKAQNDNNYHEKEVPEDNNLSSSENFNRDILSDEKESIFSSYHLEDPDVNTNESEKIYLLTRLEEHNFFIIDSPYNDLNNKWCFTIFNELNCNQAVSIHADQFEKENIFNLITRQKTEREKEAIIINLEYHYLDQLVSYLNEGSVKRYSLRLKEQNRFVIFLFLSDLAGRQKINIERGFKESIYYQVDFLQAFLERNIHNSENIAELTDEIRKQRNKGLWGTPNDNHSFYQELKTSLPDLIEGVEIRKRYDRGTHSSPQEFLKSFVYKVNIKEVIPKQDNALKIVFFVATFFKGLTLHDFLLLIDFLVDLKESQTTAIPTDTSKKKKKKNKKRKKKGKNKSIEYLSGGNYSFKKDWINLRDKLFQESYLTIVISKDRLEIVDFQYHYLREDLKPYFEKDEPIYLSDTVKKLLYSKVFLSHVKSKPLRQGFVKLLAAMAAKDPETYGSSLLWDIVKHFNVKNIELNIFLEDENQQLTFGKLLRKEGTINELEKIIVHLTDIVNEILYYPHLRKMVDNFLEVLADRGGYSLLLILLTEIQSREVFHVDFDILRWIKKLIISDKDSTIQKKAYDLLLKISTENEESLPGIIKTVSGWKKESVKGDKIVMPFLFVISHKFVLDLCQNSIVKIDPQVYGKNPSSYLLFTPIFNSEELSNHYINLIITNLFENNLPIIRWALTIDTNQDRDTQSERAKIHWETQYLLADLIEEWFLILRYNNAEDVQSKEISRMILISVSNVVPRFQKKWLITIWRRRRRSYLYRANQLNRVGKKRERMWMKKRKIYLGELIREFSTIEKNLTN